MWFLNINDNNDNNFVENRINTIENDKNNRDNNTDEKIIKNNSILWNSKNKTNLTTEKASTSQRFSFNFRRYNIVKRNAENCGADATAFKTNITKRIII